jgi:hypothetical protein
VGSLSANEDLGFSDDKQSTAPKVMTPGGFCPPDHGQNTEVSTNCARRAKLMALNHPHRRAGQGNHPLIKGSSRFVVGDTEPKSLNLLIEGS